MIHIVQSQAPYSNETTDQANSVSRSIDFDIRDIAGRDVDGSGAEESTLKGGYYRLMLYAGLFGGLFSLVTTGYITLYNQGIKFFGKHSVYLYNINFWPLILLGIRYIYWSC